MSRRSVSLGFLSHHRPVDVAFIVVKNVFIANLYYPCPNLLMISKLAIEQAITTFIDEQ